MPAFGHSVYSGELLAFCTHAASFAGYRAFQKRRARTHPGATLQSQQSAIRAGWVTEILRNGEGVLGVQTLRNALMGSVFFASNTIFLVIGVLSLAAQEQLGARWALLDPSSTRSPHLTQAKLFVLLLTLLFAFFCFIGAIRLFVHASVSIGHRSSPAGAVIAQVESAWRYQGLGVRCYYFAAPVLFWLFGAVWLVLASLGTVAVMHAFDSLPRHSREGTPP